MYRRFPGDSGFPSIDRHDDPMFVPGAVKYLGLDGLISLAAPGVRLFSQAKTMPNHAENLFGQ